MQSGAKWNFLGFEMGTKDLLQNNLKKADGSTLTDKEAQDLDIAVQEIAEATDPHDTNTDQLESGDSDVQQAVKHYLEGQGFEEEGIEQYLKEYNNRIESYQEEMKRDKNYYFLKPVEVFADAEESAAKSPIVKHAIGIANGISDVADIVTSKYPGNTAFGVVSGSVFGAMTTNLIVAGGMVFMWNNSRFMALGGVVGGYVGGSITEKVEEKSDTMASNRENNKNHESSRQEKK